MQFTNEIVISLISMFYIIAQRH